MLSVRRLHRYLMALIGIQVLIWMLSGLYMVIFDIDYIRGNHLTKPIYIHPNVIDQAQSLSSIYQHYTVEDDISVLPFLNSAAYAFESEGKQQLVDVISGQSLLPLTESQVRTLAISQYRPAEKNISSITYFDEVAPSELAKRHLPVWRVTFESPFNDTLYISANTGQVVTKRHLWWRVFDIFWMLHIMDYETRSDVSNWLLRFFSSCFILSILTGIALVVDRFKFSKRMLRRSVAGK